MENKNFLAAKFGIEVEFTGITRRQAAEVAARYLGWTNRLDDSRIFP
jgi:hypothetical protein